MGIEGAAIGDAVLRNGTDPRGERTGRFFGKLLARSIDKLY
jgi:hypothetical protein